MAAEFEGSLEECLGEMSKEEMACKIKRLTESNRILRAQVKNLQRKGIKFDYRKTNQKPFDFTRCVQQKIALKVAYIGWDYQGFAFQENTENTIEHELFAALQKTCLIESRESCCYSRCGRTDKGVSAFGQVISLRVRAGKTNSVSGINYVKSLNQVLPRDIRILSWAPVAEDFDARFRCCNRTYKYFFPLANLDIKAMGEASRKLIGEHDFRNFCKVDVGNNVNHFIRKIESIQISPCDMNTKGANGEKDQMFEITICGLAFLWHQVRCMVSVLFLVGLHLESVEVIDRLLDIEAQPRKPQYSMVSEIPLVLYDCSFDAINWMFETDQLESTARQFRDCWTEAAVRKSLLEKITKDLHTHLAGEDNGCFEEAVLPLMTGHRARNYRPLVTRPVCDGLERHLEKQAVKRRRLEEKHEKALKD